MCGRGPCSVSWIATENPPAPQPANSGHTCFLILSVSCARVKMVAMNRDPGLSEGPGVRPYRGIEAAKRLSARRNQLLAAGLDLLGSEEHDIAELTVRGVCRRAGLSARYFYESFTD